MIRLTTISIIVFFFLTHTLNGQKSTESDAGVIRLDNGMVPGITLDAGTTSGLLFFPGYASIDHWNGDKGIEMFGGPSLFNPDAALFRIQGSVPNTSKTFMTFLNNENSNSALHESWNFNMSLDLNGAGTIFEFVHKVGNSILTPTSISSTGGISNSSDKRLKTNIQTIKSALPTIMKLNATYYNRKVRPDKGEYGFIAQEVEEILPDVISVIQTENGEQYMMNYTQIIPILTKAIQEQQYLITNQNDLITDLQNRIQTLEKAN